MVRHGMVRVLACMHVACMCVCKHVRRDAMHACMHGWMDVKVAKLSAVGVESTATSPLQKLNHKPLNLYTPSLSSKAKVRAGGRSF